MFLSHTMISSLLLIIIPCIHILLQLNKLQIWVAVNIAIPAKKSSYNFCLEQNPLVDIAHIEETSNHTSFESLNVQCSSFSEKHKILPNLACMLKIKYSSLYMHNSSLTKKKNTHFCNDKITTVFCKLLQIIITNIKVQILFTKYLQRAYYKLERKLLFACIYICTCVQILTCYNYVTNVLLYIHMHKQIYP